MMDREVKLNSKNETQTGHLRLEKTQDKNDYLIRKHIFAKIYILNLNVVNAFATTAALI